MKHIVYLTQGECPDYPEGTRTVHHAYCITCLWYQEGENLARLESATENHIYERRFTGFPETSPRRGTHQ